MTIMEISSRIESVKASSEIGKAMLADAVKRGDKRKAQRVRMSLAHAECKLVGLSRKMEHAKGVKWKLPNESRN